VPAIPPGTAGPTLEGRPDHHARDRGVPLVCALRDDSGVRIGRADRCPVRGGLPLPAPRRRVSPGPRQIPHAVPPAPPLPPESALVRPVPGHAGRSPRRGPSPPRSLRSLGGRRVTPSFPSFLVASERKCANSELLRVAYCDEGRYVTSLIILVFFVIRGGDHA